MTKKLFSITASSLLIVVVFGAVVFYYFQKIEDVPLISDETENAQINTEYDDLIVVNSPLPNETVSSPLIITGEARGYWFFEATFPIVITDWDGLIIGEGYATAKDDWMTEEFIPFTATLTFEKPLLYNYGSLILQNSNPSGLPEFDKALEIPVRY